MFHFALSASFLFVSPLGTDNGRKKQSHLPISQRWVNCNKGETSFKSTTENLHSLHAHASLRKSAVPQAAATELRTVRAKGSGQPLRSRVRGERSNDPVCKGSQRSHRPKRGEALGTAVLTAAGTRKWLHRQGAGKWAPALSWAVPANTAPLLPTRRARWRKWGLHFVAETRRCLRELRPEKHLSQTVSHRAPCD